MEPISVTLVFDAPATTALNYIEPGVITSDQVWDKDTRLNRGTYTINPGVTVTLTGRISITSSVTINGGGRIVKSHIGSGMFYIFDKKTLTLENITVDGNNVESGNAAIRVDTGTLNLNAGAVIQNNYNVSDSLYDFNAGGGVLCDTDGVVNINGGIIRNCRTSKILESGYPHAHGGGGVYLRGGICNMTAGSITGNEATSGGAVYVGSG